MTSSQYPSSSYSKSKVNWAGKVLCDDSASYHDEILASSIIDDWRAAHRRPLAHISIHLRNLVKYVNPNAIIAQRLKRTPSIRHKLERWPEMKLSRMQDIGGCRVVLTNVRQVRAMTNTILTSHAKHTLSHMKDYISTPKESGYRGVHLIYKYHSTKYTNHCGLMVEIQLRTNIQHAWATGVETVGTFLKSPLKSSIGPSEWLEFFSQLSSVLHIKESQPRTYKRSSQFLEEAGRLGTIAMRIDAQRRLSEFGTIIQHIEKQRAKGTNHPIYVLHLQPTKGTIYVYTFALNKAGTAMATYRSLEKSADVEAGEDVVLVNASSIQELRKAYPNYFMDTRRLVQEIEAIKPFAIAHLQ